MKNSSMLRGIATIWIIVIVWDARFFKVILGLFFHVPNTIPYTRWLNSRSPSDRWFDARLQPSVSRDRPTSGKPQVTHKPLLSKFFWVGRYEPTESGRACSTSIFYPDYSNFLSDRNGRSFIYFIFRFTRSGLFSWWRIQERWPSHPTARGSIPVMAFQNLLFKFPSGMTSGLVEIKWLKLGRVSGRRRRPFHGEQVKSFQSLLTSRQVVKDSSSEWAITWGCELKTEHPKRAAGAAASDMFRQLNTETATAWRLDRIRQYCPRWPHSSQEEEFTNGTFKI